MRPTWGSKIHYSELTAKAVIPDSETKIHLTLSIPTII